MLLNRAIDTLTTAGIATAVTTGAALIVAKQQTGAAAAGLNATSHIAWGDEAFTRDEADLKHTLVGGLINAGAMVAWSALHELLPRPRSVLGALGKGAAVSAAAFVTDYYVVPERLTPGFEQRFSARALALTYGLLAGALALGSLVSRR